MPGYGLSRSPPLKHGRCDLAGEPPPTDYFSSQQGSSTPRTISRPTEEPMVQARLLAEAEQCRLCCPAVGSSRYVVQAAGEASRPDPHFAQAPAPFRRAAAAGVSVYGCRSISWRTRGRALFRSTRTRRRLMAADLSWSVRLPGASWEQSQKTAPPAPVCPFHREKKSAPRRRPVR